MSPDQLEDLAANATHGPTILTLKTSISNAYISIQPYRMMASPP